MNTSTIRFAFLFISSLLLNIYGASAQCNSCTMTGDTQITSGQTKTYSAATLSGASFFWSVTGNLSISGSNTGSSVSITGGSAGSGKVCVTRFKAGTQPCCSCIDVTIKSGAEPSCPPFNPPIYATNMQTGEPNTICPNNVVGMGVYGSLQGYSVQWTITPSVPVTGGGGLNSSYLEFTDVSQYSQYYVTATFYCSNGQVAGGGSLTVNETLLNCDWIPPMMASGAEESTEDLSVFPNPANSKITVRLPESDFNYTISIVSRDNSKMYEITTTERSVEIDISQLPLGIYFVNAVRNDKWSRQVQFLKK